MSDPPELRHRMLARSGATGLLHTLARRGLDPAAFPAAAALIVVLDADARERAGDGRQSVSERNQKVSVAGWAQKSPEERRERARRAANARWERARAA